MARPAWLRTALDTIKKYAAGEVVVVLSFLDLIVDLVKGSVAVIEHALDLLPIMPTIVDWIVNPPIYLRIALLIIGLLLIYRRSVASTFTPPLTAYSNDSITVQSPISDNPSKATDHQFVPISPKDLVGFYKGGRIQKDKDWQIPIWVN